MEYIIFTEKTYTYIYIEKPGYLQVISFIQVNLL